MAVEVVELEREALYREVWVEPVITVAKRYGLSDVGLRKICKKLGVPLPPAGYWAKVRHGKKPLRPPLPDGEGSSSYSLRRYIPEPDKEFDSRLEAARATTPVLPAIPGPTWRTTVADCHPLVKRVASRMRRAQKDSRGWPAVGGEGLVDVRVSQAQQNRALFLLDAVLQCCSSADFRIVMRGAQCR